MNSINALLFDLDGTLIDSRADLADAVNFSLNKVGLPKQSQDEIIPHVGNGLTTLLARVFGPDQAHLVSAGEVAFGEFYWNHCTDKTILYEGVRSTLEALRESHAMGIVTNKPIRFAQKILNELQVAPFFSVILGGDSLKRKKPHPEPVQHATKALGQKPAKTMMMGDGHQDIEAGQAAQTKTCAAQYGYGFEKSTLILKPDYSVNRFAELKEILS